MAKASKRAVNRDFSSAQRTRPWRMPWLRQFRRGVERIHAAPGTRNGRLYLRTDHAGGKGKTQARLECSLVAALGGPRADCRPLLCCRSRGDCGDLVKCRAKRARDTATQCAVE